MLAGAERGAASPEVRELWATVMEGFVRGDCGGHRGRARAGVAPNGIPARDLAISLNLMNERVLLATFAGLGPAVAEPHVVDTLVAVWLGAIYGEPIAAGK